MKKEQQTAKSALVVEGGAMRGIFSAGVLHAFGENGFDPFDLYLGVSAGACNLAAHLAGQNDRNRYVTLEYSASPKFISYGRFFRGGHLMDLDWLWDITIREYRLDLDTIFSHVNENNKEFLVVATSMETGRAMYLRPDKHTLEDYLKVSSSVPLLYRTTLSVGAEKATDGGVADSIPVIEAYRRGARHITVLRSRPSDYSMKKSSLSFLYPFMFRNNPDFARAIQNRYVNYNESVHFINHPPDDATVIEIAPPENLKLNRTCRDKKILEEAYRSGINYGYNFMKEYQST